MCPLKDDVRKLTKQPKLTAIIQSLRLTLFGHSMRMDNNAQHHPTGSETSPSYAPRSSRFGSELPSEEEGRRMALRNRELHARNDDDD